MICLKLSVKEPEARDILKAVKITVGEYFFKQPSGNNIWNAGQGGYM